MAGRTNNVVALVLSCLTLLRHCSSASCFNAMKTTCTTSSDCTTTTSQPSCMLCLTGSYCGCLVDNDCTYTTLKYCSSGTCTAAASNDDALTEGGTQSFDSSLVYTKYLNGVLRKTRVVTQPDTEDAFQSFVNTFVVPLLISLLFLAGLIYGTKYVSQLNFVKKMFENYDKLSQVMEGNVDGLGAAAGDLASGGAESLADLESKGAEGGDPVGAAEGMAKGKLGDMLQDATEKQGEMEIETEEEEDDEEDEEEEEEKDAEGGCCGVRKLKWRFTAWQWIWVRLTPPLLTWCMFCVVTAAGAGKSTTIQKAYLDSQNIVTCMVYKNTSTSVTTWWEDPYGGGGCGPDYLGNATLLYGAGQVDTSGSALPATATGNVCRWGGIAVDGTSLKRAFSFAQWAYATPIITILVTILILSGAFFLSDANKKDAGASSVTRAWTDTQTTITWKSPHQKRCMDYLYPIAKVKTIDFYAVERVRMDRSMILYLPVAMQNFIKRLEKTVLAFFKKYGATDEDKAPASLMVLSDKPHGPMAEMYKEAEEFIAFFEANLPPPPEAPPANAEKKVLAAHAYKLKTYKSELAGVRASFEEYAKLKKDLQDVQNALTERKRLLGKVASKKGQEETLKAAMHLITEEFAEYIQQIVEPDRSKGSNLFASVGPMTLLRAGIAGSPTEVPAQSLSLLLATITFANNYYCDSNVDSAIASYAIPPGTPGCPSALVAFSNVSLLAITAYKSFSGPTALAVALSLINSITTIISKMEAQTKELIKRIKTRGEDMICSRLEGDELPPPSCRDSLSCNSAGAVRTLRNPKDDSESTDGDDAWEESESTSSSTKSSKADGGKGGKKEEKEKSSKAKRADEDQVPLDFVTTRDGVERNVDLSSNYVYDDDGDVIGKYKPKTNSVRLFKAAPAPGAPQLAVPVPDFISGVTGIVTAPISLVSNLWVLCAPQGEQPTRGEWAEAVVAGEEHSVSQAEPPPIPRAPSPTRTKAGTAKAPTVPRAPKKK